MSDSIPLSVVADRLEELGRPGCAGAVRALEFVLSLKKTATLDDVLIFAKVRLRDAGEPLMQEAVQEGTDQMLRRNSRFREIQEMVKAGTISDSHAAFALAIEGLARQSPREGL